MQGDKTLRKRKRRKMNGGALCYLCGKPLHDGRPLSTDHVIPKSKGGTNHSRNLKTVHQQCNQEKGDMTLREYRRWKASGLSKKDWLDRQIDALCPGLWAGKATSITHKGFWF